MRQSLVLVEEERRREKSVRERLGRVADSRKMELGSSSLEKKECGERCFIVFFFWYMLKYYKKNKC